MKFKITPFSFFQTNSLGAEVLYSTAREFVGETKDRTIFDLYSGTGTIAQILAPVAKEVIGVEIVSEAVENARRNAQRNGVENVEFLCADAGQAAQRLAARPVDVLVVDPPRKGLDETARDAILKMQPPRVVYVSCDPATLARDVAELCGTGYRLERAQAFDLFPRTNHVETVVLLSKGEIDSKKVRVEFSLEDMDMSGFQNGATYEQIKAYVLEKHGLKVSSLYISQIKRKCGLDVGQNYNLSKKENSKVPQCPPEKEAAIMEALKHFQMT